MPADKRSRREHDAMRMEAMEPRMLLSADLLGLAGLPGADNSDDAAPWDQFPADPSELLASCSADNSPPPSHLELSIFASAEDGAALSDQESGSLLALLSEAGQTETTSQLLFVDTRVPDYAELINQIRQNHADEELQIYLLDAGQDGIAQITDTLAGHTGIDAIHVISHGSSGGLQLGSTWLSNSNINGYVEQLGKWSGSLTQDADLLLYGCDLAADGEGEALVDTMASLTGADVAASVDLTGHQARGGDWDLEFRAGTIETSPVFDETSTATWAHLLATETYRDRFDNVAFDGSNGSQPWSNDWQEVGESNGAGTGGIYVGNNIDVGAQGLFVGKVTEAWRQVDLSGATTATLSFDYSRVSFESGTSASLQISTDGATWDTLQTFTGSGTDGGLTSVGYDISAYIDSDTRIRFDGNLLQNGNDFLFVDNVQIQTDASFAEEISSDGAGSAKATAMDAAGNYVVVWSALGEDGDGWGIFAQRYDSAGAAQGGEILVNQTTADDQRWASVGMRDSGEFVVTWTSSNQDGTATSIYARQFDAVGTAVADEFRVNTEATGAQTNSSIDVDASGNFIVVWQGNGPADSDGVFFRRFDAAGSAVDANEVIAHTATNGTTSEFDPVVAWQTGGKFVVAWQVDTNKIYFQRFDNSAAMLGARTQIDSGLADSSGLSIDSNASGAFAVAYKENVTLSKIYTRAFNEDGSNVFTAGDLVAWRSVGDANSLNPSVAITDSGEVLVSYQTAAGGGDIYLQRIDADGSKPDAAAALITAAGDQSMPSLAILDADNYAIAWNDVPSADIASLSVGSVNNAPTLADTTPTLTAIDEDDFTSAGDSVAAIVVDGSITDAEGAVESIAITAVDDTNGTWQYSTDNGGSWANVNDGSLAVGHALLLDGTLSGGTTQKLRFVPDADYNGSATFTFRAWDQSSGSAGTYADTTTSGGTTAYSSATDSAAITVNAVNDAPTLGNNALVIDEGETVTLTTTMLSASDADNNDSSLIFNLTGVSGGQFELTGNPGNAVTSFTQQQISDSEVVFVDNGDESAPGFNVSVSDGSTATTPVAGVINFTNVNDKPTLTAAGSNPTFTEGGSAASLFSGTSVSTVESGQTLSGLTLTVSNVSDGSSEIINVDGAAITLINGNSGATNNMFCSVNVVGTTATLTLNGGTLSSAAAQTLVNTLSYQNNSNDPDTSNRVVTLTQLVDSGGTANSGDDTATLNVASTVAVVGVNDVPTLTTTASNPTFTEGGSAASLFSSTSVGTVESGQTLKSLTLTVTNVNDGPVEILNIDGSSIALTDGNSGTTASNSLSFSVSLTGTTATVTLSGGTLSTAATQTLFDALSYQNGSNDPDTSNRVVTLTQLVDSGGTANSGDDTATLNVASTVAVVGVNDVPTLTASAADPTFTEGGSAAGLFSSTSVGTVESGQTLKGLTLTVTNVNDGSVEILNIDGSSIALTDGNSGTTASNSLNFSVSLTGTTATVTLSGGTLSTAATQTLFDALSYQNGSNDPDTSNRVVTLTQLVDSGGTANGGDDTATLNVASTVAVVGVNDVPTLTASAADPTFTEGGSAASLFSSTSVGTVESGQTLKSLTLTVTNVNDGPDEILNIDCSSVALTDGNSGTTATNSLSFSVSLTGTTATVTLSGGTLSTAATQTLVNTLSYQNDSSDPDTSNRVVTLTQLVDSGGTANSGDDTATLNVASTVTVNRVNDAPSFNQFFDALGSTDEETEVEITFAIMRAVGDESDIDGTVEGFLVKSISSGTLKIGTDAASATAWAATTNDVVDGTNNAYWTPAANANGILDAFVAAAVDNAGVVSTGSATGQVIVRAVNDAPTGLPTISGTASEHVTLSADTAAIGDADGLGSFNYQWLRDSFVVDGATGITYVLDDIDVGGRMSVKVSYIDGDGTTETLTSAQTAVVSAVNDVPVIVRNQLTLSQGESIILSSAMLAATDADNADGDLQFTVTSVAGGRFEMVSNPGVAITGFTQAQVTAGQVRFVDNGDTAEPEFTLRVSDSLASAESNASIDFTPNIVLTAVAAIGDTPAATLTAVDTLETTTVEITSVPEDIVEDNKKDAAAAAVKEVPAEAEEVPPATLAEDGPDTEDELNGATNVTGSSSNRPVSATEASSRLQSIFNNNALHNPFVNLLPGAVAAPEMPVVPKLLASEIHTVLTASGFLSDLDRIRGTTNEASNMEQQRVASTIAVSTGLSVGYVAWLIRSGVLLSTALSSLPAWHFVDPLPVLGTIAANQSKAERTDDEEDSVESMFKDQAASADKTTNETETLTDQNNSQPPGHSPQSR